ncbi:MAG: hypothetical protein ACXAC7_12295 [Candidatus Hodarchaeales archaeon]|jgi:hypothetical protein
MYKCIELNKSFETKKELFTELIKRESDIISLKKAAIQKSAEKGQIASITFFDKNNDQLKAVLNTKDGYIYPVINTSLYLDSHLDVHGETIWNKTVKEQKERINFVSDHQFTIPNMITWAKDVNVIIRDIPWSAVGKEYTGETKALIFEIEEDKIVNADAKKAIDERRDVECSLKMQYVVIELAIDSPDPEFKKNKKLYDKTINKIANKDKAQDIGYYWWVSEAKIIQEGSLVINGSNDATGIIYNEPSNDTQKHNQPSKDTEQEKKRKFYLSLNK